jgi:hypothetical protein
LDELRYHAVHCAPAHRADDRDQSGR